MTVKQDQHQMSFVSPRSFTRLSESCMLQAADSILMEASLELNHP